MKEIQTEIEINTSAERVWHVLTDFPAMPEWNPFMQSAQGKLTEGTRLKVRIQPPSGMGMTIRPTTLRAEPNRELRWIGRLIMPGLFDGEHSFTIEPLEGDRVKFVQGERFTGVLVPLLSITGIFKNTLLGFSQMNQVLKERSEQSPGQ